MIDKPVDDGYETLREQLRQLRWRTGNPPYRQMTALWRTRPAPDGGPVTRFAAATIADNLNGHRRAMSAVFVRFFVHSCVAYAQKIGMPLTGADRDPQRLYQMLWQAQAHPDRPHDGKEPVAPSAQEERAPHSPSGAGRRPRPTLPTPQKQPSGDYRPTYRSTTMGHMRFRRPSGPPAIRPALPAPATAAARDERHGPHDAAPLPDWLPALHDWYTHITASTPDLPRPACGATRWWPSQTSTTGAHRGRH